MDGGGLGLGVWGRGGEWGVEVGGWSRGVKDGGGGVVEGVADRGGGCPGGGRWRVWVECVGGGGGWQRGRWRRGDSDVTQMVIEIQLTSPVMVVIVVDVVVALSVA